jgi:hypothetical protein
VFAKWQSWLSDMGITVDSNAANQMQLMAIMPMGMMQQPMIMMPNGQPGMYGQQQQPGMMMGASPYGAPPPGSPMNMYGGQPAAPGGVAPQGFGATTYPGTNMSAFPGTPQQNMYSTPPPPPPPGAGAGFVDYGNLNK